MGKPFASLFPDVFGVVEFRRILGEEMNLNEILDFLQPLPNSFCLVPRCVIPDQVYISHLVAME